MAIEQKEDDLYALMGLGDIHTKAGNYEKALKYFNKIISLSDHAIVAITSTANIYRRQGHYEKAKDCYDKALKINPSDSYSWHGKADCLRGMKDYSSAIGAWQMALKYGMGPKMVMTRIGDAYLQLSDFQQAEIHYKKALDIGYDKFAYLGMVKIHIKKNHMDKAIDVFSILFYNDPNDPRVSAEFRLLVKKHPAAKNAIPGAFKAGYVDYQ